LPNPNFSRIIPKDAYIDTCTNVSDSSKVDPISLFPSNNPYLYVRSSRDIPTLAREIPDESIGNELPSNIPSQVEFHNVLGTDMRSLGDSFIDKAPTAPLGSGNSVIVTSDVLILFKIIDAEGHTFLTRCRKSYASLIKCVSEKLDGIDCSIIRFHFIDSDGDTIQITSDDCLNEAISLASDRQAVKLILSLSSNSPSNFILNEKNVLVIGFISSVTAIAVALIICLRSKK